MKRTSRGTSLTEYALILGIAVAVFTIAAMGQMNQEVKGTYNNVISNMGGVTEEKPLNETRHLDQWEHWNETGSMTQLADIYAGKLSNAKPGEWVRLNGHTQFQYRIDPQSGQLVFDLKDTQNNPSGNTTAVEGGTLLKAFSQTMEKWATENQTLSPTEKSDLHRLSQLGYQLADEQITIDEMKKTQLSRHEVHTTLDAYNQLPMLYAQFNKAAQSAALNHQTLPLAALISSVTYYNYLSQNSLETNKNLLNQNNFLYNISLGLSSYNHPPATLDMVKPSQDLNGQHTQDASKDLRQHGV
jgi:Flp pilus assembly pilin Flp